MAAQGPHLEVPALKGHPKSLESLPLHQSCQSLGSFKDNRAMLGKQTTAFVLSTFFCQLPLHKQVETPCWLEEDF